MFFGITQTEVKVSLFSILFSKTELTLVEKTLNSRERGCVGHQNNGTSVDTQTSRNYLLT